jgi:hypothetical protein
MAGLNGAGPGTDSEVVLTGDLTGLIQSLGNNFTSNAQSGLVGRPHKLPGGSGRFTGNYRQNTPFWGLQVNTGTLNGTGIAEIDIDQFNPNGGLLPLIGHGVQVGVHKITSRDTNPFSVANALGLGSPCTGGN